MCNIQVEKMGRIKPRGRYMAISVPIGLHKEIVDYVEKSSYNSIAEFVKDACREKIHKNYISTKKDELEKRFKELEETIKEEIRQSMENKK